MRSNSIALLTLALIGCSSFGPTNTFPDDDTGDTASAGAPNIVLGAQALDFGLAGDINELINETVTVQNNGVGPLEIDSITIPEPFDSSYNGASVTIQPGAGIQLTVSFRPGDYLTYEEQVSISSNDPDEPEVLIALTGGVVTDQDGDGHDRPEAGGDDCDDQDAAVYPGAPETWYDGVDSDCAGDDDFDQDGDGYTAETKEPDPERGGGDCNDANPEIYPGAEDAWYDGVDGDCADDNDYDKDGDGFGAKAYGKGKDCNDEDPEAYPGAVERFNGVLDDCDGQIDQDMSSNAADYQWTGEDGSEATGYALGVGDLDGDGVDDLAVGRKSYSSGSGAVTLILSSDGLPADGATMSDAFDTFEGAGRSDALGSALRIYDDVDGDGDVDLAVGASGATSSYGAIYLLSGADASTYGAEVNDAHTSIKGSSSFYYVGRSLAGGDLDGDGLEEVIFSYSPNSSTFSNRNHVGVYYGGAAAGVVSASAVDATFTTNGDDSATYEALGDAHDLNGDGYDDWVFSDPDHDDSYNNEGAVWILWGRPVAYAASGLSLSTVASTVVTGDSSNAYAGSISTALPDVDGDGLGEVALYAGASGEAHLIYGSEGLDSAGSVTLDETDLAISLSSSYDPSLIRSVGDFNDDGLPELGVGVDGEGASTPGRLFLFTGGDLGALEDEDAMASFEMSNDDNNTYFTTGMPHTPTDLDGDGAEDLVVGDYGYDGDVDGDGNDDTTAGAVYVFLGN